MKTNNMKNCVDVYTLGAVNQQKKYCGKIKELEARLQKSEEDLKDEKEISRAWRESEAICNKEYKKLLKQNDIYREALEKLIDLHMCEQEGIGSGMPTPKQWIDTVDEACEALKQAEKLK